MPHFPTSDSVHAPLAETNKPMSTRNTASIESRSNIDAQAGPFRSFIGYDKRF